MTDAPTCPCGKPSPDLAICPACIADLTHQLDRVPGLWSEMCTRLAGTRGIDYSRLGGSPASERPLAIDRGAYEGREVVSSTLETWARVLVEEGFNYEKEIALWPPF